ncbi:MAG: hypothetical protein AB7Q97_24180 [Gammaproteobacteria bacterium]
MTLRSSSERAALIARAPTWGIGTCVLDGVRRTCAMSWDDFECDVRWAQRVLVAHGVGPGAVVMTSSAPEETHWFAPFELAAIRLGAAYAPCDARPWDVTRNLSYLRRLPVKVYLGANAVLVAAFAAQGPLAEIVRGAAVLARPDALAPLRAAGLSPFTLALLGPAIGAELPARDGVCVNAAQWRVESVEGALHLSTVDPARACQVRRAALGLRGRVTGSAADGDQRIALDVAT